VDDPTQLGKPLVDELQGIFRISFGRYRILYRVESNGQITVVVVMVGIRKQGDKIDVYELARRLKRHGKL
jgi:mRNA interferase RelE/StbE